MSLHRFRSICVLVCLLAAALPAFAEKENKSGDGLADGLKFGVEKSISMIAEMGYNTNCKAKDLDYESDDSWYCGVFAALSDAKKKEHDERVMHHLQKIRGDLANVKAGVAAIQEGQERLYNLNQQILLRLDEVGPETTIGQNLSHIRSVYTEQYVPLFSGEREFTADRLRNFAHRIVFVDRIHDRLGVINDQLTVPQIAGKEPLLRAYARRSFERMRAANAVKLDPSYVYLESIVDGLLAEQRKGYLMYVWATETLQSDCEVATAENNNVAERCKDFRSFPHTATEYRKVFANHLAAQLGEMNAGLEFMALAASEPHSRKANFLHPDAERLFARADLFTAANVGEGFGVRGRVISMGDAFNGKVRIGNVLRDPWREVHRVKTEPAPLDWWKASTTPLTYDVVNFADQWRVYHYHAPEMGVGRYSIDATMPYKSEITVANVELSGSKVPFGSFTAIERAGGGYALLSGQWASESSKTVDQWKGDFRGSGDMVFNEERLQAGVLYFGDIEWKLRDVGSDQHYEGARSFYAVSPKKVRYPAGGDVTLRANFGETFSTLCPNGACADTPSHAVVLRQIIFTKGPVKGRPGVADTRAAFLLDNDVNGSNGFVWARRDEFEKNIDEQTEARNESKRIHLDGTGRSVIFGGAVKINIQTSGAEDSRFRVMALPTIDNAYLTLD